MKDKYELGFDPIGPEDEEFWDCVEEEYDENSPSYWSDKDKEESRDVWDDCGMSREDFFGEDDPEMLEEAESDFLNSYD